MLITENNIGDALIAIRQLISNPLERELILLESRYQKYIREEILGIAKKKEYLKINLAVLDLLDEIERLDLLSKEENLTRRKIVRKTERNDLIGILIKKIGESIKIDQPKDREVISDNVIEMEGRIEVDLPADKELWIFQKCNGIYYHTDRSIEIDYSTNRWIQENLNFGVDGKWELIICLVEESGVLTLQQKIQKNNWMGFKKLPNGVRKVKSVFIEKK